MRILILSCNTGEGHNAAGHAMEEVFNNNGHEAVMLDFMALKSRHTSKLVGGAYVEIAKHAPKFFYFLYRLGGAISSQHHKSPVYFANIGMAKYLNAYLKENPCDVILCPHLYPAETITYMKRHKMLSIPSIAIATDYTCIPFFEETECDRFVIAHQDLMSEYVKRGVPKEKLYPLGIPVSASFQRHTDCQAAKEKLKLDKNLPMFLIMGGSMGFGKIQLFTLRLLKSCKEKENIVVICGNNKKLYRVLKTEFFLCRNVKIIGYTKHVSEVMDAADVIFTKPGGLTSTEVAVKNKPLVHTAPIPGCESKNAAFFTEHKLSLYDSTISGQIAAGMTLLQDKVKREEMIHSQRSVINANAASDIMSLAKEVFLEGSR